MTLKLKLIICSVLLFVIAVGFNALFNLNSFDKLYIESNVSKYRTIGKELQRHLELGLSHGKSLHNFLGIETLLHNTKLALVGKVVENGQTFDTPDNMLRADDISISVAQADGRILCSDNQKLIDTIMPASAIPAPSVEKSGKKSSAKANYVKFQNTYITTLPVRSREDQLSGFIVISFEEKQIKAFLERMYRKSIKPAVLFSVSGLILLIGLLYRFAPANPDLLKNSKRRVSLIIFLVISTVQISTSALSTYDFKQHFLKAAKENNIILTEDLKRDIEFLLKNGMRIDRMFGLDRLLGDVVSTTPEVKDITVYDSHDQPLYRASGDSVTDFQRSKDAYPHWVEATKPVPDPDYNYTGELKKEHSRKGYISINTSKDTLYKKIADIGMDSLTVIVISILFLVELLILIFKYIEWQNSEDKASAPAPIHYGVMRPAAFLFLFGIDISISFLPLHMETLYVPLLGLSKDTIMGLPISVEFLFVGIAILASGIWLDRRGWHEPFLGGLILAGTGVLYSWLAPNALHFIISRAVVGLGYGLALMASQGFVITFSDGKSKAQGLAHLFAGIYAGSICGGATGAMLAERIGYNLVFLSGAIILFAVAIYTLIFMRDAMKRPALPAPQPSMPRTKGGVRIYKFMFNRTVLSLIFFSSLPAAIAVVGFLNYFSPIYLNRIGASQSTIGQVLMIYGICLIYFGPYISRYVDASNNKKVYIFFGCFLGSMSFLIFHVLEGIAAAATAILLLGFSSSFVLASQSAFALKLKVTQDLGEGKAIGIFRSTSRVGQMLGPIVFSAIIVATNINQGITFLGIAYLLTALLFILFTQRDIKTVVFEDA